MFHNFRVSVTTHGITENRLSPFFAPKLFDRCISSNQHTSGKLETNETLQLIQVKIEIAIINFSVVDCVLLNALQDMFVNKQVKSTVGIPCTMHLWQYDDGPGRFENTLAAQAFPTTVAPVIFLQRVPFRALN